MVEQVDVGLSIGEKEPAGDLLMDWVRLSQVKIGETPHQLERILYCLNLQRDQQPLDTADEVFVLGGRTKDRANDTDPKGM